MEILENGQEKHIITESEREELNQALAHRGFYNAALDDYEVENRNDKSWITRI